MTFAPRDYKHIYCDCLQPGCPYCDFDGSITNRQLENMNLNTEKKMDKSHKIIQVFNEGYNTVIPQPKVNAVTVLNEKDAKTAFHYIPNLTFVITLNEETGTFGRCYSYEEANRFYTKK